MGFADRVVRLLIAIFLIDVAVNSGTHGGWRIAAWVVAGVFILTSLAGRCPLYSLLHIHSNKVRPVH